MNTPYPSRTSIPDTANSMRQPAVSGTLEGARVVGSNPTKPGPGPDILAADTLENDSVMNRAGEKLGKIEHIMLDIRRGRVAYAVLSSGGFLGIGDKLFAIPWNALTLDADRECFVLDIAKQRLEQAPGFDKDRWPSMAETTWATDVHRYYGTPPYWTGAL